VRKLFVLNLIARYIAKNIHTKLIIFRWVAIWIFSTEAN